MKICTELKNPSLQYRPVPFWSWNDKLDPQELRNQINLMHDAGLGGYFMHARGGLLTEYMGEEWFDCVRATIDEGRKLGMRSWAYDENGWPSGFGDGSVNGLGLCYQQKYLRLKPVKIAEAAREKHTIAFFRSNGAETNLVECPDTEVLHCYYDVNPYYVDTLDAEVTRTFLEKIYQPYQDRLSRNDWQELTGFFTDEPQVSRNGIPWSFIMEAEYVKAYGEKLLPLLPQLFLDCGYFRRTRYRFWRLVTLLFMNNFMKQIYDWCEAHGTKITGHHVLEETYYSQITSNGAIMPQYQFYHIPGMDWLGRHIKPVTAPVQVASVCAQTGKKQVLSETFALCGWNVKFEELKWIYQWQMVHGINLLCQHLESYSLKGIRKRDYPASLFRHQPWWNDYRQFNDYVSRLGVLLSEGEIRTDVLVLHGQSSAWLSFTGEYGKILDRYFDSFNQLSELMDSAHINYHYGDETMIAMHGAVTGSKFVIGKQRYGVLVMPQMKNFSPEVYALVQLFVADGGRVLAVKNQVEDSQFYVGGEPAADFAVLADKLIWFDSETELATVLHHHTASCPVVKAGTALEAVDDFAAQLGEIAFTRRYFDDIGGAVTEVYYFANNDLKNGYDSEIYLSGKAAERFDPATGEFVPVFFHMASDGRLVVPHYFCPAGDLVLALRVTAVSAPGVEFSRRDPLQLESGSPEICLDGEYRITAMTPNLLTLDYCSFSFDGELQAKHEYVMSIQDRMLRLKRPVNLEMEFKFKIAEDYDFTADLFLIMEMPQLFKLLVNGMSITTDDCGFLFDPAFRKINIGKAVQVGENSIRLQTLFSQADSVYKCIEAAAVFESEGNKLSYTMEIEAIYLAGSFGVKTDGVLQQLEREAVRCPRGFTLGCRPETVNLGKAHESGLPFFCGKLSLSRDFGVAPGQERGRYLLLDRQMAVISRFRINGRELDPLVWKPFCICLDGLLQPGMNRLEIELTNSLRNMLGPHHLAEGESYAVGPFSFYKEPGVFAKNWNGALTKWNDDYCLVEFGLDHLRIV
jgi:hypothetical protein